MSGELAHSMVPARFEHVGSEFLLAESPSNPGRFSVFTLRWSEDAPGAAAGQRDGRWQR
jgi:hypothetical protein